MKLIIAEKPDQGATLASVFPKKKHQGYIEILPNPILTDGGFITWAIGHLCQLSPPEVYNTTWKKWTLDTLPLLPNQFQHEVSKDKIKQFQVIKKLLSHPEVNEVIHAGDAGREGELIIRNILRQAKSNLPMKRLWISSLTPNAIKKGFQQLLDEEDTRNLFFEAYTRSCADWIVGMNASRLYTLLLQQKGFSDVFSVGRVQTPTLALIVKKELEIESFVSEPFWEVEATFKITGKKYKGKWEDKGNSRIMDSALAEKIALFCQGKEATIADIKKEKKEFLPPQLYNLSALQAEANRRYKFSPKKTLDIVQKLYQKGWVSYPRSDSRHITTEEANTLPQILARYEKIKDYEDFFPLPFSSIIQNKRYVDEKKVTDHYAIIPTEQIPDFSKLASEEKKLYDLIAKSVIAAHHKKAIIEYSTIRTLVDERAMFISKGKVIVDQGYRQVISPVEKDKDVNLPLLDKGDKGITEKTEVKESKTQPPKRYTEGQLITLMKTAGKHIDDKELEQVLTQTEGLGTEATRAGIITMLKDRGYIDVKKNIVYATSKAKVLIIAVGKEILASPEMTAKWEQRLKQISKGEASPKQFMDQTSQMVHHLIAATKEVTNEWIFSEEDKQQFIPKTFKKKRQSPLGNCQLCDGQVVDKGKFFGCSNYQKKNCTFTLSKKILGKSMTQKIVKQLLKSGETDVLEGFQGKDKLFAAALVWDKKENKIKFKFPT
ncbi:DNA topoisomerase III [Cytobacillus sp. FSL W7-1323]|uniref:DNA topoisomerase n=1 Tax=Cytobacillus kochii TaxID=859143 RepID=A0A248TM52_9BACI|nr:DNA topoisomerase III [Cytobacillus kochii]ASV69276.1 DNA topoisomerase III [Cytobacillus kochii]